MSCHDEVKKCAESIGIEYLGEELDGMSENDLKVGYIKFNIPNKPYDTDGNGEGVWGWVDPETKQRYEDDSYNGQIQAILCNNPFTDYGVLRWGMLVQLKCHGPYRPSLDMEWLDNIIKKGTPDQDVM